MKEYHRATITIPLDIYRKVKMRAALQNKSVSRFITDLLKGANRDNSRKDGLLPFGKYSLKGKKRVRRKDIYEPYLQSKVSH